jgi:hypothetical protein
MERGTSECTTKRRSALSTPIPKALVATTTERALAMKASCVALRTESGRPAW